MKNILSKLKTILSKKIILLLCQLSKKENVSKNILALSRATKNSIVE